MNKVPENAPTSRTFIILLGCGITSLFVVCSILLASGQKIKMTRTWVANTVNDLVYLLQFVSRPDTLT